MFVFPTSSERELRELLALSLEHISTFSHLIATTYTMEITDEERALRDSLNQSVRADLGLLAVRIGQAGLEVNWSRYAMTDYAIMISKIKAMQAGLITSYSSLVVMERYQPEALEIVKSGLDETGTGKAFRRLRRSIDLCVADIVKELAVGKQVYHSPVGSGAATWEDFLVRPIFSRALRSCLTHFRPRRTSTRSRTWKLAEVVLAPLPSRPARR